MRELERLLHKTAGHHGSNSTPILVLGDGGRGGREAETGPSSLAGQPRQIGERWLL